MRFFFLVSFFMILPSLLFATPIVQQFIPQPRIEVPSRIAGADQKSLKEYEVELALRFEKKPDDPFISHKLGTVLFHQGRREEAKAAWNRASKEDPNLASADLMADVEEIFSLIVKGKNTASQEKLFQASQKHKDDPHFFLIQGEQFMGSRLFDQAEKSYFHALELNPELYIVHLSLGRFYEFQQDHEKAKKHYTKACRLGPDISMCWEHLGRHQFREGDFISALSSFKKVRAIDPLSPIAEIQIAKLSYSIRDYIGARYWYKIALKKDPENPNAIRVTLSDVQFRLGLLGEALTEIDTVLKSEEIVPILVAKATIHESRGEADIAFKNYQRALELFPENIIANNNIAMLMIRENMSPNEALLFAERAFKSKQDNPQIIATYACALAHAENNDLAEAFLHKAVRISPADVWVRYFLGKLLYDKKQFEQSRLHLDGVLLLDPNFKFKKDIQQLLKQLK